MEFQLPLVWFLSPPIIILSAAVEVVVDGVGGQAVVVMVWTGAVGALSRLALALQGRALP